MRGFNAAKRLDVAFEFGRAYSLPISRGSIGKLRRSRYASCDVSAQLLHRYLHDRAAALE